MTENFSARKAALRAVALRKRAAVEASDRRRFAERLSVLGLELARERPSGAVALFAPVRDEPDCGPLLAALAAAGFETLLPSLPGATVSPLVFRAHKPGEALSPGPLGGIPEPPPLRPAIDPDLVFTPCAAFDRRGGRIGFGKGFYDATLSDLRARKTIRAIGVAFACQEIDEAPLEAHDQRLDAVVTEREILVFL